MQTKQSKTPTETQKAVITAKFAPLLQRLNDELPPLEEPQVRIQCIRVFTKWWRNFFYIMQEFKCPPEGYTAPGFEVGISRMEFRAENSFDIAYFRHTGPLPLQNTPVISGAESAKSPHLFRGGGGRSFRLETDEVQGSTPAR
ncbi:MAG: hypothetical protein IPM82_32530 [Saprospiraceae bacterium]|nr:hypothetical protein [Saprospiraceae bacterium]